MKTLLQRIASYGVICGLSLSLLLCFCLSFWWLGLSPLSICEIRAFRCYYALLLVALAIRATACLPRRALGEALLLLGLFAALLQGAYWCAFSFAAKTSVGLDDGPDNFYAVDAGFLARPPKLPLVLLAASPGAARCRVSLEGRQQQLDQDRAFDWHGLSITLNRVNEAPLFVWSDDRGAEREAGYLKLRLDRPEGDFFEFAGIPHRFYVSRPGAAREIWKKQGKLWNKIAVAAEKIKPVASDQSLHLSIVRGKLSLFDGGVRKGERVSFENQSIRFEQGIPWIEISVVKVTRFYLLYLGGLLAAAGILLLARRRKS